MAVERERESCQSVERLSAESVLSTETIQLTERVSRMNGHRESFIYQISYTERISVMSAQNYSYTVRVHY